MPYCTFCIQPRLAGKSLPTHPSPPAGGGPGVAERSSSARFRGKLRRINSAARVKSGSARARPFWCASPLRRVFRGDSSRRDREDISPETGFLSSASSFPASLGRRTCRSLSFSLSRAVKRALRGSQDFFRERLALFLTSISGDVKDPQS